MEQLEQQIIAGVLFVLGGVLAYVGFIFPMANRRKGAAWAGFIGIGKHKYSYDMGDQLLRFGGAAFFSGIDIFLPKRMPHIFLDAHRNNHPGGRPEFVFENDNRISLEGDFDHVFQAYAPKQHKSLALSILTPDVMRTLMKHAHPFDVEIYEHHVRLIVPNKMVSGNEQLQHELLAAAKAIMKEVDHRLKSWNEASLTGDTGLDVRRDNRLYP